MRLFGGVQETLTCHRRTSSPVIDSAQADDVCTMKDAHQIYPKLGLLANVGLIVSGRLITFVNTHLAG